MLDVIKKRLKVIDFTGATAVLVLLALAFSFAFLPLFRKAKANAAEAETYRGHLSKLDGLSKTMQQVESDLKQTRSRLAETESQLPSEGNMDDFMRQLAKVADQAGLQVDTIGPKQAVDGNDYKVMPIEISGVGSFDSCYKFLIGLRHMNRLTRLDDLIMSSATEGDKSAPSNMMCRMTVQISTFMAR